MTSGPTDNERMLPAVPLAPLRVRDPQQVGDFRLLGRLGSGGMGVAYLADGAGQWAVVKVARGELAEDASFRARMLREIEILQQTESPYTSSILGFDIGADEPWFAMEFIPGMNLARRVEESGPLQGDQLTAFVTGLAEALAAVHSTGVIHRDIKPANIMMSPTGPRIIDFGISGLTNATQLTRTGSILGTAGWLAPEQVRGDQVTAATDVHAWALCVLFAATGSAPFASGNEATSMYRVLETTPEIPEWIKQPLRRLLISAVDKDPKRRPETTQIRSEISAVPTSGSKASPSPRSTGTARSQAGPDLATPSRQQPDKVTVVQHSRDHRKGMRWPVLILVGCVISLGIFLTIANNVPGQSTTATPTATPTETPTAKSTPSPPLVNVCTTVGDDPIDCSAAQYLPVTWSALRCWSDAIGDAVLQKYVGGRWKTVKGLKVGKTIQDGPCPNSGDYDTSTEVVERSTGKFRYRFFLPETSKNSSTTLPIKVTVAKVTVK